MLRSGRSGTAEAFWSWKFGELTGALGHRAELIIKKSEIIVEPFGNREIIFFGGRNIPFTKVRRAATTVDTEDARNGSKMIPKSGSLSVIVSPELIVVQGFRTEAYDTGITVIF